MTRIACRCMLALMVSVAGLLAPAPASAESAAARVARLTDLVVQAIPLGEIFETLAAGNADWPVQDRPDAVSTGQLACLRDELSPAGYRRAKRSEVVAYIAEHPGQVDADIDVLERGAARMMGTLMLAGVEQERTGIPVDQAKLMGQASAAELEAFMQMMTDQQQATLRRLLGIGDAVDPARSSEEHEAAGEQAGADLATRVMLKAMSHCSVPSSVLFD